MKSDHGLDAYFHHASFDCSRSCYQSKHMVGWPQDLHLDGPQTFFRGGGASVAILREHAIF